MSSVSTSSVASAKIEEREKLFINIGVMEEGQMTMTPRMLIFSGGGHRNEYGTSNFELGLQKRIWNDAAGYILSPRFQDMAF